MKFWKPLAVATLATMFATTAQAQTVLVGDRDCFGNLGGPGPNGCSPFGTPAIGTDARSAGEAAATNGAQQTDFYSANFSPLPTNFSVLFPTLGTLTSASITYRTYGLQANTFGPFVVNVNGTTALNFLGFEDGATSTNERTYNLTAAQLAAASLSGTVDLNIDRNGNSDAVAFDYFELTYATSTVPEPSTYALMAAGLAAMAAVRRRRRTR